MRPSDGRGVEQLAARRAHNPKVAGSSPAPATIEVEVKSGEKDLKKSLTICKKFFIISPLCCRRSEDDGAAELIFNNLNNR